jgi:hypothetical protein
MMNKYPFETKTPEELAKLADAAIKEQEKDLLPEEEVEQDAEAGYFSQEDDD